MLTAASISGQFASLELSALQGRYIECHLIYGTDRVTLEILASEFTADFDMDGDVDGADPLKEGFGRAHRREQGDADGDLDVDGADFLAWQQQLGSVSSIPMPR